MSTGGLGDSAELEQQLLAQLEAAEAEKARLESLIAVEESVSVGRGAIEQFRGSRDSHGRPPWRASDAVEGGGPLERYGVPTDQTAARESTDLSREAPVAREASMLSLSFSEISRAASTQVRQSGSSEGPLDATKQPTSRAAPAGVGLSRDEVHDMLAMLQDLNLEEPPADSASEDATDRRDAVGSAPGTPHGAVPPPAPTAVLAPRSSLPDMALSGASVAGARALAHPTAAPGMPPAVQRGRSGVGPRRSTGLDGPVATGRSRPPQLGHAAETSAASLSLYSGTSLLTAPAFPADDALARGPAHWIDADAWTIAARVAKPALPVEAARSVSAPQPTDLRPPFAAHAHEARQPKAAGLADSKAAEPLNAPTSPPTPPRGPTAAMPAQSHTPPRLALSSSSLPQPDANFGRPARGGDAIKDGSSRWLPAAASAIERQTDRSLLPAPPMAPVGVARAIERTSAKAGPSATHHEVVHISWPAPAGAAPWAVALSRPSRGRSLSPAHAAAPTVSSLAKRSSHQSPNHQVNVSRSATSPEPDARTPPRTIRYAPHPLPGTPLEASLQKALELPPAPPAQPPDPPSENREGHEARIAVLSRANSPQRSHGRPPPQQPLASSSPLPPPPPPRFRRHRANFLSTSSLAAAAARVRAARAAGAAQASVMRGERSYRPRRTVQHSAIRGWALGAPRVAFGRRISASAAAAPLAPSAVVSLPADDAAATFSLERAEAHYAKPSVTTAAWRPTSTVNESYQSASLTTPERHGLPPDRNAFRRAKRANVRRRASQSDDESSMNQGAQRRAHELFGRLPVGRWPRRAKKTTRIAEDSQRDRGPLQLDLSSSIWKDLDGSLSDGVAGGVAPPWEDGLNQSMPTLPASIWRPFLPPPPPTPPEPAVHRPLFATRVWFERWAVGAAEQSIARAHPDPQEIQLRIGVLIHALLKRAWRTWFGEPPLDVRRARAAALTRVIAIADRGALHLAWSKARAWCARVAALSRVVAIVDRGALRVAWEEARAWCARVAALSRVISIADRGALRVAWKEIRAWAAKLAALTRVIAIANRDALRLALQELRDWAKKLAALTRVIAIANRDALRLALQELRDWVCKLAALARVVSITDLGALRVAWRRIRAWSGNLSAAAAAVLIAAVTALQARTHRAIAWRGWRRLLAMRVFARAIVQRMQRATKHSRVERAFQYWHRKSRLYRHARLLFLEDDANRRLLRKVWCFGLRAFVLESLMMRALLERAERFDLEHCWQRWSKRIVLHKTVVHHTRAAADTSRRARLQSAVGALVAWRMRSMTHSRAEAAGRRTMLSRTLSAMRAHVAMRRPSRAALTAAADAHRTRCCRRTLGLLSRAAHRRMQNAEAQRYAQAHAARMLRRRGWQTWQAHRARRAAVAAVRTLAASSLAFHCLDVWARAVRNARVEDSSCRIAEAARSRAERTRAIATWRDVAVKRRTLRRAHRGEINGRVWRRALSKWGAWAQNRSMQRVLDWRAQTWRSNILARAALRVLLRFATRRSALLQRARDDWPECMRLLRTRYPHPLGGLLRRSFAPWRRKTAQLSWARRVALARQRVALLGVSIQLWHCRAELNRTARRMLGQWSSRAASRAMRLAETGPISVPRRGPTPEPHEAEHAMRRWRMHRALALIHAHAATRRVSRLCDATVARFRVTHVGHRALSTWRGAIIAQRSQAGGGVSEDAASSGPRGPGVAQSEGLFTDQGGSLSRLSQSEMARARSAAPYGQSLPFSRADGLEGRAAHASPQGEAGAVLVDQYMLESPTDAARADASSSRPTPTPRTRVTEADGAQHLRQHAEGIRANAAMPSALLLRTEVVAAQHAVPPPPVARGGVARSAMEESVVGGSVLGSSAAEPSRDAHASILDRATVSAARDAAGPAKAEPTTPPPPPPQSAFRQRSLPAAVPERIEQRTPRRQSLPGAAPGQIAPSSGPTESATQQPAARAAPTSPAVVANSGAGRTRTAAGSSRVPAVVTARLTANTIATSSRVAATRAAAAAAHRAAASQAALSNAGGGSRQAGTAAQRPSKPTLRAYAAPVMGAAHWHYSGRRRAAPGEPAATSGGGEPPPPTRARVASSSPPPPPYPPLPSPPLSPPPVSPPPPPPPPPPPAAARAEQAARPRTVLSPPKRGYGARNRLGGTLGSSAATQDGPG